MTANQLIPMSIKGLMLDPMSNSPIVVLKDDDEKLFLPIWVGIFEANAIALQLENITTPRPMTHDLLRAMPSRSLFDPRRRSSSHSRCSIRPRPSRRKARARKRRPKSGSRISRRKIWASGRCDAAALRVESSQPR